MALLPTVLLACAPPGGATSPLPGSAAGTAATTAPATTAPGGTTDGGGTTPGVPGPPDGIPLDGGCAEPADPGPDPLQPGGWWHHEESDHGFPVEHTDVAWDAGRGLMLATGQGGLAVYEVDEAGVPTLLALHPGDTDARWYQLELLDGAVALSDRDEDVVTLVDLADPAAPRELAEVQVPLPTGMAWAPPHLLVLGLDGALTTLDLADPAHPVEAARTEGLFGTPWELALAGTRGWVADSELGLVPLDLADPLAPAADPPVPVDGTPLDVDVEGGLLALAAGSGGLQLHDLADPAAPAPLATFTWGASVQRVALTEGLAWGVDREEVVLVDAADPAAPVRLGYEPTPYFAMGLDADGETAFVGDWSDALVVHADRSVRAAAAMIEATEIYVDPAAGTTSVELANAGAVEMAILGGEVDDARVGLWTDRLAVAPGEAARLDLAWDPAALDAVDATLCVATDAGGGPMAWARVQDVSTTGSALVVGEEAPLFTLDDLDGDPWTLADHLGSPVVIVFFSTWCPGCVEEMLDLDATTGAAIEALGGVLVAIGPDDDLEDLRAFRDALGLELRILWDEGARVHQDYENIDAFPTASYPEEWVVGTDGRIAYVNNRYEPDELLRAVEEEALGH